ncbi:unnamed protein product, partial [marine sediment metagenome]
GYIYIALDLAGFRSGSMNEPLNLASGKKQEEKRKPENKK